MIETPENWGTADAIAGIGDILYINETRGYAASVVENPQISAYANALRAQGQAQSAHPRYYWYVDAAWAQRESEEPLANETRRSRFQRQWNVLSRLGIVD